MKRVCILCEDAHISEARESAKALTQNDVLTIPVSQKGNSPATHWFCCLSTDDAGYANLLSLQKHSVIEEMGPKEFLSKWNLKIIKS